MKRIILLILIVFLSGTSFAQKKTSKKIKQEAYILKKKQEWDNYLIRVKEDKAIKFKLKSQKDSIEKITPKKIIPECTKNSLPFYVKIDSLGNMEEIPFSDYFQTHVKTHFVYPEFAIEHNIQGKVLVSFIIDENGNITNIETMGPINGLILEEEAIRIVKKMPRLIPAECDGVSISYKKSIPITFSLKE